MARSPPPPTGGPHRAEALWVFLALLPLSLLYLWPLPADITHLTPAEPDAQLTLWHPLWLAWLLQAEEAGALLQLHTGLVSAPAGVDLRYFQEWLTAGVTATLGALTGSLVAGQTLGFAAAWSLSGAASWILGRSLGGRWGGALAAAATLSAPFLRGALVTALPEFLWFGLAVGAAAAPLTLARRGAVKAGLLAGALGALAGLATRYLALGAAGWLAVIAIGAAAAGRRAQAGAAALGLAVMSPALLFMGWPQLTAPPDAKPLFMALPVWPSPSAMFLPTPLYNPTLDPTWETHTWSIYVGWILIGAALVGAWRGGWRERTLLAGAAAFLVLAAGWRLPGGAALPLSWLAAAAPVLENLHAPSRFVMMAQIGLAGAAASAIAGAGRWAPALVLAVLLEAAWVTRALLPLPTVAPPEPSPAAADIDHGVVLEVSLGRDDPRLATRHDAALQLRQMRHGRPLINMPAWPGGGAEDPTPPERTAALLGWFSSALPEEAARAPYTLSAPSGALDGIDWLVVDDPAAERLHVCAVTRSGSVGSPGETVALSCRVDGEPSLLR